MTVANALRPIINDRLASMLIAEAMINLRFLATSTVHDDLRKWLPANANHEQVVAKQQT